MTTEIKSLFELLEKEKRKIQMLPSGNQILSQIEKIQGYLQTQGESSSSSSIFKRSSSKTRSKILDNLPISSEPANSPIREEASVPGISPNDHHYHTDTITKINHDPQPIKQAPVPPPRNRTSIPPPLAPRQPGELPGKRIIAHRAISHNDKLIESGVDNTPLDIKNNAFKNQIESLLTTPVQTGVSHHAPNHHFQPNEQVGRKSLSALPPTVKFPQSTEDVPVRDHTNAASPAFKKKRVSVLVCTLFSNLFHSPSLFLR